MKKELREILQPQDKFTILGQKKIGDSAAINVLVPWGQADEKTINGRIYPKALLQREVDRIQKAVESGSFIGTGDHPKSGLSDIATASHLVKKIWLDEGGRGWAQIKVLDTERGKNIQSLIKGGGRLGISTRGFGQVGRGGRVDDDYKLMGIDIVMNPSVSTATFTKANIFESVNFEGEEKSKKTKIKIDEKNLELAIKIAYGGAVDEYGYGKGLDEFRKERGTFIKAQWLVENYPDEFQNVEQALKFLGEEKLANKYADEPEPITHYEATPQLAEEAFMLGITVEEYVKKLNETAGHQKADIPADEAQQAGVAGETKLVEKMVVYPDGVKRIAYVSEKVDMHEAIERVRKAPQIVKPELTEEQKVAEADKKAKELKEAKRERIIYEVNRDISAAGGTSPEKLKELVRQALKEEGLLEED